MRIRVIPVACLALWVGLAPLALEAAPPFYPSSAGFTIVVDDRVFCDIPEAEWADRVFTLVLLYRENDADLPFFMEFFDSFDCAALQSTQPVARNNHRSVLLDPGTVDKKDDFWLHVLLIEEPQPFSILEELGGIAPLEGDLFFGLLNWDRLAELGAVGSATAFIPVVPSEGVPRWEDHPKIRVEPIAGGDADGDFFSTNNRYRSFHDCDDSDITVNPFSRELMDDSVTARDNNCDGLIGANYQRLLISTSREMVLQAEGIPLSSKIHRRFRAYKEDVVTLLVGAGLGKLGQAHLSHIAFNGSNLAEGLRKEDVDALIAIDRDTGVPGFEDENRLRAGDLILSFRSKVPKSSFGTAGAALTGDVRATDLVLYRRAGATVEMFFDGSDVGLNNNIKEDIDAADLVLGGSTPGLQAGYLLLSTAGRLNVSGLSGRGDDVFAFQPQSYGSDTSGSFFLFIDGDSAWKKNVSGLSLFELDNDMPGADWSSQLMVATRSGYSAGPGNIGTRDLAVWYLLGNGDAEFKAAFYGEYVDLGSDDGRIDAVDLDRFAALMGRICTDQTIDGTFVCAQPATGLATLILDGVPVLVTGNDVTDTPANQQIVAVRSRWLEPLPITEDGSWGWDRLRPGSYGVSFDYVQEASDSFCIDMPPNGLPVTLAVNERRVIDLPLVPGTAHISGFVYLDQNLSASYDPGEEGAVKATANLYLDDGDGIFSQSQDRFLSSSATALLTGVFSNSLLRVPCSAEYWLLVETQPPLQAIGANPFLIAVTDFISVENLEVGFTP